MKEINAGEDKKLRRGRAMLCHDRPGKLLESSDVVAD